MAERLPRVREPLPLTFAVARDRAVVRQGESASGLWIVESGALLVTVVARDGRALALDVLGPGDAVGEPDEGVSPATVRALRPCRLRSVPAPAQPGLLAARASRAAATALDLAWLDVPTRVGRRLDDLATRFGRETPTGVRIALALTQDDLAALTGATRESVNRALRRMERARRITIEGRGRYVVPAINLPDTVAAGRS
jgi:CRP/FNR family cyclic AMP-dependent transcriptional regulator